MITEQLDPSKNKETAQRKRKGRPKKAALPDEKNYIVIDHPANGERIHPHHYSVRIGASGEKPVEISIDGGEWKSCRHAGGYYWYDWSLIPQGSHKIVARLKLQNGKFKKSKITNCQSA